MAKKVSKKVTKSPKAKPKAAAKPGLPKPVAKAAEAAPAKKLSKTAQIMSFPSSVPAAEVVAKLAAKGVKVTTAYVYVLRSRKTKGHKTPGRKPGVPQKPKVVAASSEEQSLRQMIALVGITRTMDIVESIQNSI